MAVEADRPLRADAERNRQRLLDGLRAARTTPLPKDGLDPEQLQAAMECWRPARR